MYVYRRVLMYPSWSSSSVFLDAKGVEKERESNKTGI